MIPSAFARTLGAILQRRAVSPLLAENIGELIVAEARFQRWSLTVGKTRVRYAESEAVLREYVQATEECASYLENWESMADFQMQEDMIPRLTAWVALLAQLQAGVTLVPEVKL
jgi:hypothetical protein